jgi:FtsP/CotA-like multicopper oxidase with cupredoxin domain
MDAPAERTGNEAGLTLLMGFLALIGLFVGITALVVAWARDGGGGKGSSSNGEAVARIVLSEFAIKGDLEVPPGTVTFDIVNEGSQVHNFAIRGGQSTADIQPGAGGSLRVTGVLPGEYEAYCTISGHADSGMKAPLVVREGAVVSGGRDMAGHGNAAGEEMDFAKLDATMEESMMAYLDPEVRALDAVQGNQVLQPRLSADGWKEFDLTAKIVDWEVSPGTIVKAWTYNGTVPGPQIKVEIGDKVRMILTNNLPMATDLHLHDLPGKRNDMDGVAPFTQDLIRPGETFTYEFEPKSTGVAMFHPHHHGQMQLANGMIGSFIVGEMPLPRGKTIGGVPIPADVKIAQEMPMVLNDAGVIGLSLNGKGFPATTPISSKVGDWILVHYMNEGMQSHPMHPHQFLQLVVARDGVPLDSPYWADTINVAPGERYTVLMNINNPGVWAWHCHILNHAERETGMYGMVTAIIAEA